jgi:hypothetical protein
MKVQYEVLAVVQKSDPDGTGRSTGVWFGEAAGNFFGTNI